MNNNKVAAISLLSAAMTLWEYCSDFSLGVLKLTGKAVDDSVST